MPESRCKNDGCSQPSRDLYGRTDEELMRLEANHYRDSAEHDGRGQRHHQCQTFQVGEPEDCVIRSYGDGWYQEIEKGLVVREGQIPARRILPF